MISQQHAQMRHTTLLTTNIVDINCCCSCLTAELRCDTYLVPVCSWRTVFILFFAYQILTANDMACELFGYEENQLVGRPLKDLLRLKSKEQEVITETHLEPSGQIVSLAGKVVCSFYC